MDTTATTGRILVVDDEPMVREVVCRYLRRDGHHVDEAADGATALARVAENVHDLLILDVMLPEVDGITVLSRIRQSSDMPVILLTARSEEADRVLGLELGADDYVVKPFSPREVAARAKSVLRRLRRSVQEGAVDVNGLRVDPAVRAVSVDGNDVRLTRREFDLLWYLVSNPRQVFSREQLLRQVWDSSTDWQDPATVTVHVRRIRTKLGEDPENPRWIHTVWGVGYRFEL